MKNDPLRKLLHGFIFSIIFLISILQPLSILYKERETFFYRGYESQYESFKKAYYTSQYVQKKDPGIIPDQTLEAFAAGAFLKGINPILIVHDQPPLGRYILSLSILLFDNVNTIMVLIFLASATGVFLISKLTLKNTFFSFIPLAVFVNEPLFLNKLYNSPLLEPIQLPFIIFTLYFFIRGIIGKNYISWFILTSLALGFVASIRFFMLGFFLMLAMILYFLLKKQFNKKFIVFFATLPIAAVVLLFSYAKTIELGSPILQIFGIQKYIYIYHKSQLNLPFSFWDLLIFNKWHTWWGAKEIIYDVQWVVFWPISAILTLVAVLFAALKKILISESEKVLIIWIVAYCIFLSLGNTSTRYFLPLLPFLYIIATGLLMKIIFRFKHG